MGAVYKRPVTYLGFALGDCASGGVFLPFPSPDLTVTISSSRGCLLKAGLHTPEGRMDKTQ